MSELIVTDIAKRYGARQVVNGMSLQLSAGEVVGLLGPNGAGKTTAFYMIVGLIPCDRGKIEVDGNDLNEMGLNWQHGVVAMQPVPESTGRAWMLVCCAMLFVSGNGFIWRSNINTYGTVHHTRLPTAACR